MNRISVWAVMAIVVLGLLDRTPVTLLMAQDAAATAAEYEERIKRLNSMVEDLLAAQATLQKRLAALSDELATLREDQARRASRYATQEDVRRMFEGFAKEVERKRDDDRKAVLEELHKLAQAAAVVEPPPRRVRDTPPPPRPDPAPASKGYRYQVKPGDTLSAIVMAYQQNGVKVTLDQVIKANPHLKPNNLRPNQEVFIPEPATE